MIYFGELILLLVENGFQDAELIYPYYRFQEAGFKVVVVGPRAKETYTGQYGLFIKSDASPDEVNIDEYDAVIVPGGRAPDKPEVSHRNGRGRCGQQGARFHSV